MGDWNFWDSVIRGDDSFSRKAAAASSGERVPRRKAPPIEWHLACSLEELYKGTTKKMKISRKTCCSTIDEILSIEIKAGWKKGTKITYPERGNEVPGMIPSDLVFIIDEKPHSVFKRDGDDLIVTQNLSLVEALTGGYTAQVTTLDGRNLTIPVKTIVSSTYEQIVKGEGMPILKEPGKRGNLRLKFNIYFPTSLTPDKKTSLLVIVSESGKTSRDDEEKELQSAESKPAAQKSSSNWRWFSCLPRCC